MRPSVVFKIVFILSILNFSLWEIIKDYTGIQIWYVGNAVAYVGYIYVIYEIAKASFRVNKSHRSIVLWAEVALLASLNNLADELFFNPLEIKYTEYVGFVLIVIIALRNDARRKKQVR